MNRLLLSLIALMFLWSCKGGKDEEPKGWPQAEKDAYMKSCQRGMENQGVDEMVDPYDLCSCTLEKYESDYPDLDEAEKALEDDDYIGKVSEGCLSELMPGFKESVEDAEAELDEAEENTEDAIDNLEAEIEDAEDEMEEAVDTELP